MVLDFVYLLLYVAVARAPWKNWVLCCQSLIISFLVKDNRDLEVHFVIVARAVILLYLHCFKVISKQQLLN